MLEGSSPAHNFQADACIRRCQMEMPVRFGEHHQGLHTGPEERHNLPVVGEGRLRGTVVRPAFTR
jgi:hypothetical protein